MKTRRTVKKIMKTMCLCVLLTWVLVTVLTGVSHSSDETGGYEAPQVLEAGNILPPDVLSGPDHKVENQVTNDGFLNH